MNNLEMHKALCKIIHSVYVRKNAAYGNSFGDTFRTLGIISALTRITDKYNRLVTLYLSGQSHNATESPNMTESHSVTESPNSDNPGKVDDLGESLVDTLLDLANYCLMTVIELQDELPDNLREQLKDVQCVAEEDKALAYTD